MGVIQFEKSSKCTFQKIKFYNHLSTFPVISYISKKNNNCSKAKSMSYCIMSLSQNLSLHTCANQKKL